MSMCNKCNGVGWYATGETDNPRQVMCEKCCGSGIVETDRDPPQELQYHIPPALLEALIDLALNPSEDTTNGVRSANIKDSK